MTSDLVWFFGYGSLMWRPGFPHDAFECGTLDGFHRALCIYSWVWRGTQSRPGLVLGLAPGGHCRGRVIGVAPKREAEVLAYLDARELMTAVYERRKLAVDLDRGDRIEVWTYVARPDHEQFAGDLPIVETVKFIRQGIGRGGANSDYVLSTVAHLRETGIDDPKLEAIAIALANGARSAT